LAHWGTKILDRYRRRRSFLNTDKERRISLSV
jgi:hypothetical protein